MFLLFEVLDKEPHLLVIGAIYLVIGLVGLAVGYLSRTWVIPVLLIEALIIWGMLQEFHDPFIYPAIMNEDPTYLPITYTAMAVSLGLPFIGIGLGRKRRPNK